jgi:hypothetical protein
MFTAHSVDEHRRTRRADSSCPPYSRRRRRCIGIPTADSSTLTATATTSTSTTSPHEIRAWRDRQPTVAFGMEGAPGHQAAGIKAPIGPGSGRGFYDNSPSADSFPAYPIESYIT